jgi:L-ascorbate metabolism protein UlaG (beta-lactamase superfamily)
MRAEFISNAGFVLTLRDGRVLVTDPWVSGGAYYGSWFNYPPVSDDLLERYASLRPDWIYVSHVHPDHLDPKTLRQYPPDTPILIGRLPHRHLHRSVSQLGFTRIVELELGEPTEVDGVEVTILNQFATAGGGYEDEVNYAIDTSLVVRDGDGTTLLNVVDNPITLQAAQEVVAQFGRPDVAILPYSGASLYPHAFAYSDEDKDERTRRLREQKLDLFMDLATIIRARFVIPAAGSYVMGARLAPYNRWLHQATPAQLRSAWEARPPADSHLRPLGPGDALDTDGGEVSRSTPARADFTADERLSYALTLADRQLAQDAVQVPADFRLPWPRLLSRARANQWRAQVQREIFPHTLVEVRVRPTSGVPGKEFTYRFALDEEQSNEEGDRARVTFTIDASLLLMILVGAAIWNNVEIGALVEVDRSPDVYDPTVHSLMSFFSLFG